MTSDLSEGEKLLATHMSEISERCYSAGWMENTQYTLWDAVINGPRDFGHGHISKADIEKLVELSNMIKSWIIFDDDKEEIAVPLDHWRKKFEIEVKRSPGIVDKR
jgi:hypothetical protein